jgi:hypothetical protein
LTTAFGPAFAAVLVTDFAADFAGARSAPFDAGFFIATLEFALVGDLVFGLGIARRGVLPVVIARASDAPSGTGCGGAIKDTLKTVLR